MTGFVCTQSVIPPIVATDEPPVVSDGWFPAIDPADLREDRRIRDQVKPRRLRAVIVGAMVTVGNDLAGWQAARRAEGHATLAAVPAPTLDGESRLVILYRRAIGATAKAELVESYRDTDSSTAGVRNVDDMEPSIGELRRDALYAIRDILGVSRVAVELI